MKIGNTEPQLNNILIKKCALIIIVFSIRFHKLKESSIVQKDELQSFLSSNHRRLDPSDWFLLDRPGQTGRN